MSSSRRDRDGDRDSYQPQACNLCWKEVQAPFLVTSCNHLFCMSHRDHEAFQQSSCPGCGHNLSSKGGLKQANYDVKGGDLKVLNGVTPEAALKVTPHPIATASLARAHSPQPTSPAVPSIAHSSPPR